MIATSVPGCEHYFPAGPGGYVYPMAFVKARYPDAAVEERKAKGGYGYTVNVIVMATVDGKRKAISPACRRIQDAYAKAAERLGWTNGMTVPSAKAGDLFETPGGTVRAHRVFWHTVAGVWIVEFERWPRDSATANLTWEPLARFLETAKPTGQNVPEHEGL